MRPRILFATPVLHHPPIGGPTLRIENSIKALSQVSELYLYSRISVDALGGAEALSFYRQYCTKFYFAPFVQTNGLLRFLKRSANFIARRTIKRPMFRLDSAKEDFRYLLTVADAIQADVIWLGYGNISYSLLKYIKRHSNYKVVVDTDSVWSRFVLRGLPYAENAEERQKIEQEDKRKEEEERWGTQLADVTTAVSEVDAEYYRDLAKDPQQIHLFSNVIDVDAYQQVPPPAENLNKPCIYLAGTFFCRNCPMEDAARWVIQHVLPLVRQRILKTHFYIVGMGSDRFLSDVKDPGITITGRLSSVLPYLYHANVALVPLRFESGTRFKILEAGACGIPVVSTTLGAEGIPVTPGIDILIADEPELFANSIVKLITEPNVAITMAENLRKLVYAKYSVASLIQEGRLILEYLASRET
ncbi:MAG: glycosyltransferase [Anaerolineae bacterium]